MKYSDENVKVMEVDELFDGVLFMDTATNETVSEIEEVDESFDGVLPADIAVSEDVSIVEENLGGVSLVNDENEYEKRQTEKKIAPIVKEVTNQAVSEAVKYQQDKLKVEVNEVLQSEVGYRLDKYEKRRRRRDVKDKLGVVIKWGVVIGIVAFIYGTPQLRTKFSILFRDFGDLVEGLINNEEVSSNKLVEDALTGLGEDLNESSSSQGDSN
ncbi:MAG: hypothetical protein HDR19_03145 [Lachnospiraceae bacterium]|nr:hypothetical protein [Lachnospiraceae bacterium]